MRIIQLVRGADCIPLIMLLGTMVYARDEQVPLDAHPPQHEPAEQSAYAWPCPRLQPS
jgi:hypothetical protein